MDMFSSPDFWFWAIFGTIVCSIGGYFIGKSKGKAIDGLLWGGLLGWIGLIVIALSKSNLVECPQCGLKLSNKASICYRCRMRLNPITTQNSSNYSWGRIVLTIVCVGLGIAWLVWSVTSNPSAITGYSGEHPNTEAGSSLGEWYVVGEWSGNSAKNTGQFTVGRQWKVEWDTAPGEYGEMNFIIDAIDQYGNESLIANAIGQSKDESYQYTEGTYYLSINTAQPYRIRVWAR